MAQLELPEFVVKPSQDFKGWLIVTCPRGDCGELFLVRRKTWLRHRIYTTHKGDQITITARQCPYCSRVAAIPARLAVRYTRRSTTNTEAGE